MNNWRQMVIKREKIKKRKRENGMLLVGHLNKFRNSNKQ
jgi:hypothetical protein